MFNSAEIQRLQDEFSSATRVASIITRPDGTPITEPSNFSRLCKDIIRKTQKGLANCRKSDAILGRPKTDGPTVQVCLSGGLWDAGAAISVGGRHVANWLIGQVRNDELTEDNMRNYAREIGANEDAVVEAFNKTHAMSREQFEKIAQALFTLSNQLSTIAYQNIQQARFISDRKRAEEKLRQNEARARSQSKAIVDLSLDTEVIEGELSSAFDRITEIVSKTMNIARAGIWLLSDDQSELRSLSLYEAEPACHSRGMVLKTEIFPRYFEAILSESRILAHDAQTDPCTSELSEKYLIPLNITSMLDAGIQIDGRLAGVVCLEHIGEPRKWQSDEGIFINTIAALVAQVITNAHRRSAEDEYKKLQAQLHQAQKMESVGRLAGGVAHDFNNMLGVILGHTELSLLQADENHELHDDLKEIQKAAKRSADITKQLLAFARKQTISPKQLDLNDTVESMLNMLRRLIGEDIDLVWKPTAHLWPVKMDPSQIDQILANLCVNARDAIDGVGKLTIETGNKTFDEEYCKEHAGFIPGDFVMLAVSDNGCGMDNDTLDNLFEPFFTTKEVGKGTGLGLATIYGIVKQNNGFINVYSEPGRGSTFKIYLPRVVAQEDIDRAVPEKKAAAGGTETILLVEDEPSILRMTRMMLERNGYSVLSAATPSEAVEKATNHSGSIDLLMSDVVMPEMNGRDLAEKIISLYPEIRLLFMSGYTADVIAHQGILDDGVVFIQKPFSMADMTEKVRNILDSGPNKN